MADEHKLPAQIAARALAPAEQSESLVARGLEAIKNRQQALVLSGVEADAKKSFLEGVAAEKRGDYAEAVKWYRKAADRGYAEAQFNLGIMYEERRAPDLDKEADANVSYALDLCEAEHWFRLAAEQGYAKAQSKLGFLLYDPYFDAKAVEWAVERAVEATKWLRLAADQGYAEAQYYLGQMYHTGQGVPQDYAEATKWFCLAADQGYAEAQLNLGMMYDEGRSVPQDYGEAEKWFRLAAEQGNAKAQFNLAYRAAERGDPDARFNLGVMYAKGQGVPQDYMRAYMWFDRAARSTSDTEERDKAVKSRDSLNVTSVQNAEALTLLRESD
jgi:TPR repeat protein